MISVVIDGNIIFSNVIVCILYMHAFIGFSFFFFLGGLKYANELCILPMVRKNGEFGKLIPEKY